MSLPPSFLPCGAAGTERGGEREGRPGGPVAKRIMRMRSSSSSSRKCVLLLLILEEKEKES